MSALAALRDEPRSTRLLSIRAMLLRAAGLLGHLEPAEAERLSSASRHLPRTARLPADAWSLAGVRPSNHPATRTEGAARLVDRHVDAGLVHGLEGVVREGDARDVAERLTCGPHVGTGRAREMVVNVVLPFVHSLAGIRRDRPLIDRCLALYRECPGLADNAITREMRRLLGDRAGSRLGARRQQGLIHMYRTMVRALPPDPMSRN